jgi:hypothetical protein
MAKKSKAAIKMAETKVTTWAGEIPTPVDPKELNSSLANQNHDGERARMFKDGMEVLVEY